MVTVRVCSKLKTSLKSAKRLKMLADGVLPKHVGEMTGHQCMFSFPCPFRAQAMQAREQMGKRFKHCDTDSM